MTAPQVFLDIDLTPEPTSGLGYFYPTTQVTDPTDGITITTAALGFRFDGTPQSVQLYATDNANMGPAGWAWFLDFSQNPVVPGKPSPVVFFAPAGPLSFTATNASPAVFTWTSNAAFMTAFPSNVLPNGTALVLSGTAPTGFTTATTYYVVGSTAHNFSLAATRGGSAIASTSTGTGTFTVTRYTYSGLVPQGSSAAFSSFLANPSGTATSGYVVTADTNGKPAWQPASTPQIAATTGQAGFALTNGTPTILSWTAPADGNMHEVTLYGEGLVSSATTGGVVTMTIATPDGNAHARTLFQGTQGTGVVAMGVNPTLLVGSGGTVSIAQSSALTAGTAIVWLEIRAL